MAQRRRCTAEEIVVAIQRLLDGEPVQLDRPWSWIGSGSLRLRWGGGWQLVLWIEADALAGVQSAIAPDGADWTYGCQRDDWSLGPASRVLEPLSLLTLQQRQQLERMLRTACCPVAAPEQEPDWGMTMPSPEQLSRRRARARSVDQRRRLRSGLGSAARSQERRHPC